jgi:hypothetical protein
MPLHKAYFLVNFNPQEQRKVFRLVIHENENKSLSFCDCLFFAVVDIDRIVDHDC